MRKSLALLALVAPSLAACGAEHGSGGTADTTTASEGIAFDPPPPAAGYTRLTATTVKDVPPGGDETFCQYVMAPFDHDVDILDVQGHQSKYGHHAVVFSYTDTSEPLGTSVPCMGTEFSSGAGTSADASTASSSDLALGAYLGGIGGATGVNASPLPPGVAFRLQKGNGILLNVHYLNTGPDTIDGNAVIDMKFADVDPNRKIAAMFLNGNFTFDIAPATQTKSSVDCVAQSDVQILMMANHMHEYGSSASTEVLRAGTGAVEDLHDDPHWSYDQQFNLVYSKWTVEAPFLLHAGDTLRTTCTWDNPTSSKIVFPREMCVGVGFALASGSNPTAPACYDGKWVAGGL